MGMKRELFIANEELEQNIFSGRHCLKMAHDNFITHSCTLLQLLPFMPVILQFICPDGFKKLS